MKDLHVVNGVAGADDYAGGRRIADVVRQTVLTILYVTYQFGLAFQNTPEKEQDCCDLNHF